MTAERKLLAIALFVFWLVQLFGLFVENPLPVALVLAIFQIATAIALFFGAYQVHKHGNSRLWAFIPLFIIIIAFLVFVGHPEFMIWRYRMSLSNGHS